MPRKLQKVGNFSREETIRRNTVFKKTGWVPPFNKYNRTNMQSRVGFCTPKYWEF